MKKISKESVPVSSLALFHIPLVEMDDAWTEFKENGYKDTENFKYIEGMICELGRLVCYGYSVDYFAYSGIDKLGSQRGCTMITCKPDSSFTIDKHNFYSDRYDLPDFTREEVTMQFEDVTYQVIPE